VAKLSEKIDDLKATKAATSDYEGENNTSLSHNCDRDYVTIGDKSENDDVKGASKEDEVGDHRFVNHTYYRHKIGEGFT
jgi:hypothetical protein